MIEALVSYQIIDFFFGRTQFHFNGPIRSFDYLESHLTQTTPHHAIYNYSTVNSKYKAEFPEHIK